MHPHSDDESALSRVYEGAKELFLRGEHDRALDSFTSIYEVDCTFRDVAGIIHDYYDTEKSEWVAKYKGEFQAQSRTAQPRVGMVDTTDTPGRSKGRIIHLSVLGAVVIGAIAIAATAPGAKRRAESFNCASSIVSICCAGRMWANDHGGSFPTNFICMSNEVVTPKVLSCLSGRRARASDWSVFTPDNSTYEIVTPGVHESAINTVFLRCTVHGHLGYPDMTVFDGVRRRGKLGW